MVDHRWNIENRVLKFLPLLLLYIVVVIMLSSETFVGDEGGYVGIAKQIVGNRSPTDQITLWWGPGYSIVLIPFAFFKLPWFGAKILNALFLFGAVIYFYSTLTFWLQKTHATIIAYVLGLYPPFIREVHLLMTECFVFLLICGMMFHFCMVSRTPKRTWLHILITSFYLGYLALTKVFFGYVIIVGVLTFGGIYLWRRREKFKRTAYIYFLAVVLCLPYLFYTHSVTGRVFDWGTSGGMSLYWMSMPNDNEWGSWFSSKDVQENPELSQHREFFDRIASFSEVQRDEEFKKQAIYNIANYPKKYFVNWIANIGRMLFSYPFSYTQAKLTTYYYLIPNMFIVVLFILGIYPAILRRNEIPFEISALLWFGMIAFGGISLLSAYDRQFRPLVPILLLWLSFLYFRVMVIQVRPASEIKSLS